MKKSRILFSFFSLLLSQAIFCSCETIDESIDDTISEMLGVKVIEEVLDFTTNLSIVTDISINGQKLSLLEEKKMHLPDNVTYSFVIKSFTYPNTVSKHAGTIPKSMFTEKNNLVKVSVKNKKPTLYINDVLFVSETTNGGGSVGNTTGPQELKRIRVQGEERQKVTVNFNLPKNAKTLVITTTELSNNDLNMADLFVSRNSIPTINSHNPYSYTAQYKDVAGNRGTKIINITNAQAGDWNILLYGYNSYYWSWIIVTATF